MWKKPFDFYAYPFLVVVFDGKGVGRDPGSFVRCFLSKDAVPQFCSEAGFDRTIPEQCKDQVQTAK